MLALCFRCTEALSHFTGFGVRTRWGWGCGGSEGGGASACCSSLIAGSPVGPIGSSRCMYVFK